MTDISPNEEPLTPKREQCETVEEANSSRITDSLITALRDPSKPILCFVNPQLPQEVCCISLLYNIATQSTSVAAL